MARRDEQQRKLDLLQNLASRRTEIAHQRVALSQQVAEKKAAWGNKLNVPKRIKASVSHSPTKWLIGSTLGGLFLTKMVFGKPKRRFTKVKESVASRGLLTSLAFFAAKPLLKSYALGKVRHYVAQKYLMGQHPAQADEYYDL